MASNIANDFYVSISGDDSNPGTLELPFRTIQHATSIVEAGDTVHIRGGTYREKISIDNLHGTTDNPITFKNYNDEEVVVSGAKVIDTPWEIHEGNIWKTTVDYDISQLFLDDKMLTGARWPNIEKDWDQPDDSNGYNPTPNSFWDLNTRAEINVQDHFAGGLQFEDLEQNHSLSDLGFSVQGAMYVPHFADQRGEILEHKAGEKSFKIAAHTGKNAPFAVVDGTRNSEYYYLTAHLSFLDSPREWFYDKNSGELYAWLEDNQDPNSSYIQARAHQKGADNGYYNSDGTNYAPNTILEMNDTLYINFDGITFFSGRFDLLNTDNTTFENCKFLYSTHHGHMLKSDLFTGFEGNKATTKYVGENNLVFRNNEFAFTYGLALTTGSNVGTLLENNLFHNSNIFIKGGNGGPVVSGNKNLTAIRNTVHSMGYGGLGRPGKDNILELNHIYNFYFTADTGAITANQSIQDGLIIRYNWIHGAPFRNGIRFDGDPAGIGGTVNHNVVFKSRRGLRLKGDQHTVISNTIFNTDRYDINISIDKFYGYVPIESRELEDRVEGRRGNESYQGNFHSIAHNNAGDVIIDIPILNNDDKTHNSSLSDRGTELELELRDPSNFDFRPVKGSSLVNNGTYVEGFTDSYVGNAPDIGAYEYGDQNYWIPGHQTDKAKTPIPINGSHSVKTDADLMWLKGIDAISSDIYLGTDPDNLIYQGNQKNNIFIPEKLIAEQEYFWRIDTVTDDKTIEGDLWNFIVGPEIQELNIDFVYVDDAGNQSDTNGIGAVSYDYLISKYEITNKQYIAFLNSVASTDSLSLYRNEMSTEGGIIRSGSDGNYTYRLIPGRENHPVNYVSFWDAIYFTNWLTSGFTGKGVYNLNDHNKAENTLVRDITTWEDGGIAIASEDEWYKAAYFSGSQEGADGESYWLYPTQSNSLSTEDANFGDRSGNGDVINVGTFLDKPSHYGTYDQVGNVREWTDTIISNSNRILRGGHYISKNKHVGNSQYESGDPSSESALTGFRITKIAPNFPPSWRSDTWSMEDAVITKEYKFSLKDEVIDPEGDKLTFSKISGPEWLIVDIDGNISGTPSIEDIGENYATFRVTDSKGLFHETPVAISLLVNDLDLTAPIISGPSGSGGDATSLISIKENLNTVHNFTADEAVTWSLNGGEDETLLTIDSSTGVLAFVTAPDHENPTDSELNNSYLVSVRATDDAGNTSDQTVTINVADIEEVNPALSSTSPADNATRVAVDSNIVLTFSETVDVETGNILIKKTSDDSTVETIDVTGDQVTGSGTTQITINPDNDFDSETDYYLQIPPTAFDDASGNSYAGITDKKTLSFTTEEMIDPLTGQQTFNLDVDGDGSVTALGDGLMVIRKLFGAAFAGDALTSKAISNNATRTTDEIHEFIQSGMDEKVLDVDGDGSVTALGDGLMVIRKLFGSAFEGSKLTDKAISNSATRTTDEIHEYIAAMSTVDTIA